MGALGRAREEYHVWGIKMRSYAKRKDSPEYTEAFRRTHAAHNNIQDIRAQLRTLGVDV